MESEGRYEMEGGREKESRRKEAREARRKGGRRKLQRKGRRQRSGTRGGITRGKMGIDMEGGTVEHDNRKKKAGIDRRNRN